MRSPIRHVVVGKDSHEKLKAASGRYSVSIKQILDALVDMHIGEHGNMDSALKQKLGIVELTESK